MAIPSRGGPLGTFFSVNDTVALTVGIASSNVALNQANTSGLITILTNVGANVVYVSFGTDNTVIATAPIAGTPAQGFPILPNASIKITSGSALWLAAIASATGNTLFITSGVGE